MGAGGKAYVECHICHLVASPFSFYSENLDLLVGRKRMRLEYGQRSGDK
jgi:hypothetical protein